MKLVKYCGWGLWLGCTTAADHHFGSWAWALCLLCGIGAMLTTVEGEKP